MVLDKDAGTRLISDIAFLTQRASAQTCEIVARTIERQTSKHLEKHPETVKDTAQYCDICDKLCKCILLLSNVVSGTGAEILAKRGALDLLLALSHEVEYSQDGATSLRREPEIKLARTA